MEMPGTGVHHVDQRLHPACKHLWMLVSTGWNPAPGLRPVEIKLAILKDALVSPATMQFRRIAQELDGFSYKAFEGNQVGSIPKGSLNEPIAVQRAGRILKPKFRNEGKIRCVSGPCLKTET